ncbi:MAG: PD40 domain-containing protein [Anaerolineae bacterium]|nr:PD40 domain-containing protein [Anaerolineae bacterium]
MSNPEAHDKVNQLLQQGIEAAKAGDRNTARTLLEQVVEQDEQSEMGWFWLAAVVEDETQKRTCLGNVLVINPNNQRARRLLDRLEGNDPTNQMHVAMRADAGSGSNRLPIYLAAFFGTGAIIILVLLLLMALSGGDDGKGDTNDADTASNGSIQQTTIPGDSPPPPTAIAGNTGDESQTTLPPTYTPTPTETPTLRPATWTPVPSQTPIPDHPATLFAPPPASVSGQIIMQSGQVPGDNVNQPIVLIRPDGTGRRVIAPESSRGHAPVLSPDGSQYAYIKYAPGTRDVLLQLDNFQGTAPKAASAFWGGTPILSEQDTPAWAGSGTLMAFTATGLGTTIPELFLLDVGNTTGAPEALARLTEDDAAESWPAFSPDSTRIVYAADLSMVQLEPATELRIYNIGTQQVTPLTNNGLQLTESAPDWSPDGRWIVFHAHADGDPDGDTDIYRMPADGSAAPEKLIDSDASDIQPRYSSNGQYLVFSSNRTGNWDVFIFDTTSGTYYQVTYESITDIANDWTG